MTLTKPFSVRGQVAHPDLRFRSNQFMGDFVMYVGGIEKRDEDVHVQERGHEPYS